MRIHLEEGLAVGWTLHGFVAGELAATFAVKASYELQSRSPCLRSNDPEPVSGDRHADDDLTKRLLYPSDFAPFKPRGDVLVLATAYAPGGRPAPHWRVGIEVGPVKKSLEVFGPRVWRADGRNSHQASTAEPVSTVPLTYEEASGSEQRRLAQGVDRPRRVENVRPHMTRDGEIVAPAGFGPLAAGWSPRRDLVGTYDERWQRERWPWFPDDFDYGHFNAAPPDQQVEGYLRGDENLLFEHLHPEHSRYQSQLPGQRARCFVQERQANAELMFREVLLVLDTVWIDLDRGKLILVWRGHVPVRTVRMKEIEQVLAWTERLTDARRTAEYCFGFVAERQRIEESESQFQLPEAEADAAAEPAASDAEFDAAFAAFDEEMATADRDISAAGAKVEAAWAAEKAGMIARGIAPSLLDPPSGSESPAESLRAALRDRPTATPAEIAALQQRLGDVEQLEAEVAAMDRAFDADFPEELTLVAVLSAIARGESLANADLMGMDLTGQDLSGLDLRETSLRKTIFKGANLRNANMTGARLNQADLTDADLSEAILDGADLTGAMVMGANFTGVSLDWTDLSGLNLAGADFHGAAGTGADFSRADLAGVRFAAVKLPAADFSKTLLGGADFSGAEIPRADLDGAKGRGIILENADMTGASASDGADFTEGNFTGIKAAGAVFSGAVLDRASFSRALLVRAIFSDASLQGAVFDRADLCSASFDGAVLRQAVLTNANLLRAGFDEADLTKADLRGANLYEAGFWRSMLAGTNFTNANLKGTTLG